MLCPAGALHAPCHGTHQPLNDSAGKAQVAALQAGHAVPGHLRERRRRQDTAQTGLPQYRVPDHHRHTLPREWLLCILSVQYPTHASWAQPGRVNRPMLSGQHSFIASQQLLMPATVAALQGQGQHGSWTARTWCLAVCCRALRSCPQSHECPPSSRRCFPCRFSVSE